MVRSSLLVLVLGVVMLGVALALPSRSLSPFAGEAGRAWHVFDPAMVERIRVSKEGREVLIVRTDDGWGLADRAGYPVYADRAERLVLELSDATIIEERTDDAAHHGRLGVDDTGVRIRLTDRSGAVLADVIAGRTLESRGLYGRLVRNSDADRVVWIEESLPVSTNRADWVDQEILDLDPARLAIVRIEHPDGSALQLSTTEGDRVGETPMTVDAPSGARGDHPALVRLPSVLSRLRFMDAGPPSALNLPEEVEVVTEFETFDGLVITVRTHAGADGVAAARFEAYGLNESAQQEADGINERLTGWAYFLAIERVADMRLHPELLATTSLRDTLGPVVPR